MQNQFKGEKLKSLRKQLHMSQEDLALLLDVSPSIISSYERGTRTPTIDGMINLCSVLNLEPDYFFNDKKIIRKRTINCNHLTDSQYKIVMELINEFLKYNNNKKED